MKKTLIGCEESQAITIEMRKRGIEAYSCDLQECSGGHPEWHLKMDVMEALDLHDWQLVVLHPTCTALAVSGNRWYGINQPRHQERMDAVEWTQKLWNKAISVCEFVAMENPVGVLNRMGEFPKPQYIQPWQFGHGETKKTGFWLHGLPELKPTKIVDGREQKIWKMPPGPERGKLRSKTYKGIAEAIANQWTFMIKSTTMKSKTLEEEIEMIVNYYAKPEDKDSLTAAINKLIERNGNDNRRE